MKKRIIALLSAMILTLFCLPLHAFAAEASGNTISLDDNNAVNESDDLARYGIDEEYAIVPCNAGCSAVDLNGSNARDIIIYKANRKVNQLWKLKKVGDYYAFVSVWNGKAIDVPGANAATHQELQGYEYNGTNAQLWRLESMGDGTYSIHSKINDNYVWDIRGSSWNDNTAVQLYPQSRWNDQRFRFVHTSTVEPMSDWGASRQDCNGSDWSVWDGSMNTNWYKGNANDLYINSAADLGGLISLVMNDFDMKGKTIHLTCDINLAGIHWTPIGFSGHWFRGSFNGHNHTIVGLSNRNQDDFCGLFGMVEGGTICNLAVKGTISGDDHVGGIVGLLEKGHVCNIYSEVSITNATDIREGGIVGAIAYGGLVDHCTQNAAVNSNDSDPHRGGIAGYSDGFIRYCVNNKTVNHNWDCGGGIVGTVGAGFVEYCANHGTVGGGGSSERIGGIVGEMEGSGLIFGCYNDGQVYSTKDDYIGGICGRARVSDRVIGCINMGKVYGDDKIGGICGFGNAVKCFNAGVVTGDEDTGGIGGESAWALSCYVLAWSSANISGRGSNGGDWALSTALLSGEICYKLNNGADTYGVYGITDIFSQNIGSDPYPTFGSSPVTISGGAYSNDTFQVTVDCERGYGSVEGAGAYKPGDAVKLTAKPAAGCVFDHFDVRTSENTTFSGWDGTKSDCPTVTTKSYTDETITLTDNIRKSYTVRAVFKIFDETPENMKVTVKLELECTNDAGGWNSDILPVDLVDSAGELHRWEANRNDLDDEGERISHDFDLGTTSPVAVYVTPDFGGGFTFRSYGLKARMWVNGSGKPIESSEVTIRSGLFISSKHGGDYMSISFENAGNSTVGDSTYTTCREAWEKGRSSSALTIRLDSAWLLDSPLTLSNGQTVNLDLNGYPIIRTIKKTQDDGELFHIGEGATLNISDSTPTRKSNDTFTGGSIQGGRSDNTAGLIECLGTLNMTGGALYNGGTTDKGGAVKLSGSAAANLTNVLISNCWSDKAVTAQNEGGAIYMKGKAQATLKNCTIRNCRAYDYGGGVYLEDDDNRLNCENVKIFACTADDNQGGGIYQDHGETHWVGGSLSNCRASKDNGGGFYQNNGKAYFENVSFEGNYSEDDGGAFYSCTEDGLWFINCSMIKNRADDLGGALYTDKKHVYMENCSVTSNAAVREGGGIYIEGDLSVGGKTIIRNNDGQGTMDNLVLEKGALIYDLGLEAGSEIHLRSDSDGNVKLGGSLTSEYQMNQYFRADHGRLELTETQTVDTDLRASVFSDGKSALIIGAVILIAALAAGIILKKKQKGGAK
ncbi:RICIN domain-containing protein [Ruminococcus sp.]|uniref:RICIN domain-containing protein n=1 Tax=Ruminococcus sp. TaxID=41978 RepID=UPI00388D1A84